MSINNIFRILFHIIIVVAYPALQMPAASDSPPISIDLYFDKASPDRKYRCNEKVGVTIVVENNSNKNIVMSKDLDSQRFYMSLRIIDPAGRLLIPKYDKQKDKYENQYPKPLGFKETSDSQLIMSLPCKIFKESQKIKQEEADLNKYYDFEYSGFYSIQVQIGTMVFKDSELCSPKDFYWLGVLKSKTKYFYVDGRLPIRIIPNKWNKSWLNDKTKNVVVQIPLHNGWKPVKIAIDSIRLNNIKGRIKENGNFIEAIFQGKIILENIENPIIGKSYEVWLTGSYTDDKRFCSKQKVMILP